MTTIQSNADNTDHLGQGEARESELIVEINSLIKDVREKISHLDPIRLLALSTDVEKFSNPEEIDDALVFRLPESQNRQTEYIQSLIVSQPAAVVSITDGDEFEKEAFCLFSQIESLHKLIKQFYVIWAINLGKSDIDQEYSQFAVESQLLYSVRGNRFECFQLEYVAPLLVVHDEEFRKLFGVSADTIIDGFSKIEHALSQGRIEKMFDIRGIVDKYVDAGELPEEMQDEDRRLLQEAMLETFSPEHYNVEHITGWPHDLIQGLSYTQGEASFYEKGKYADWPVVALPSQERPFVCVDGQSYCFDYYTFVDNFYRSIQTMLARIDGSYSETWQKKQKQASERMVADIFSKMLPGCVCHFDNMYGAKAKRTENDLIIQYHDVLLVVEVKAGRFSSAPPLTNYHDHIKRYEDLIGKADYQCFRTLGYLKGRSGPTEIYDDRHNVKAVLNLDEISDMFALSVTMENINAFAARAEKISFLNSHAEGISIAVDDLLTYQDYFDSPLVFLHYLKQRRLASLHPKIALNDELDHLGMYIDHNYYSMEGDVGGKNTVLFFGGYRDELNAYYEAYNNESTNVAKPVQDIPELFSQAVALIENNEIEAKYIASSYLLDFSSEAKNDMVNAVERVLARQKETGKQVAVSFNGTGKSLRLTCFVMQPCLTESYSREQMIEYAASAMFANNQSEWPVYVFGYDADDNLVGVDYMLVTSDKYSQEEAKLLKEQGQQTGDYRVAAYRKQYGKIGRNEMCPCGSGKKYKRCHGR